MAALTETLQLRVSAARRSWARLQPLDRDLLHRGLARYSYSAAKSLHHRTLRRASGQPIVVFGMNKSGTTAVAEAVKRAGYAPVYQVHDLDPDYLAEEEQGYNGRSRPWRVWDAQCALERPRTIEAPWNVVATVREPVSQAVSSLFHRSERDGRLDATATVASLVQEFGDRWHRLPLHWFETHLETTLGVDVFAHPFDTANGYSIIETPTVRLLLLRQEGLTVAPAALAEFLGAPAPIVVPRVNLRSDKGHGELYARFLREIRPPPEVVDEAYSSRMVRHFYSPAEIAGFRQKWSAKGSGT